MAPGQHAPVRRTRRRAGQGATDGGRTTLTVEQRRELVRNRLIESRLTPNAISLTGLALNVLAAVLVWERLFFIGGSAVFVGAGMDRVERRDRRGCGEGD